MLIAGRGTLYPIQNRRVFPVNTYNIYEVFRGLRRDPKSWIILAVGAGWFLSIGVRFSYPTLLPFFRSEFGMDLTTAGLLLSVLWFAYALGQFPGGVLGDRLGEGNILVWSTAVSMIAILTLVAAGSVWMLFVGSIAFGFATAVYGPTRFTIFTDIYEERAGTAVGLTMAAGSIGNTVLPVFTGVVATYAAWQFGFVALLPLFLGATLLLIKVVPARTSPPTDVESPLSRETVRRIIEGVKSDGIPLIVAIQILLVIVSQGFIGFFPTYLIEVKNFSAGMAATIYGVYFAVGVVVQPLTGHLQDSFGSRLALMTVIGLFFLGLVLLPFATGVVSVLFLTLILSFRNGTGVVNNTYISDNLDSDIKGSGLGLLRSSWIFIGATSPMTVGYLADRGYFKEAFFALAFLAGCAVLLAMFVRTR